MDLVKGRASLFLKMYHCLPKNLVYLAGVAWSKGHGICQVCLKEHTRSWSRRRHKSPREHLVQGSSVYLRRFEGSAASIPLRTYLPSQRFCDFDHFRASLLSLLMSVSRDEFLQKFGSQLSCVDESIPNLMKPSKLFSSKRRVRDLSHVICKIPDSKIRNSGRHMCDTKQQGKTKGASRPTLKGF